MRLSPEYRLILACARTTLAEQDVSRIHELLRDGPSWGYFATLARWHRVSALVGLHLSSDGLRDRIPEQTRGELEAVYRANAERHRLAREQLARILEALGDEGIRVVVLKGAALAGSVYPDPAVRSMGDLLVEESHLARADAAIRRLGYESLPAPEEESRVRERHHHYPRLVGEDGVTHVELHRHLVQPESPMHFDIAECWAAVRETRVAGVDALALSAEDMLLNLCMGFFFDRRRFYRSFAAIRQLVDISETVRCSGASLDWTRFALDARRRGAHGAVHCGLATASVLLGAEVPERGLRDTRPRGLTPSMIDSFIERTVLETKPWFFHELVESRENTRRNLLRSAVRRMLFDREYLTKKYWPFFERQFLRVYLHHLRETLRFIGSTLRRPGRVRADMRVDRWMHDLESTPGDRPPPLPGNSR